jgi:hypothetical protein
VRSSFRSTRRSYLTTSVLKQHSVMRLATPVGGSGGETVAVSHQTFHTCDALPWLPNRTLKVNPRNSLPLSEQHGGGGQVTCTRWWETPGHALGLHEADSPTWRTSAAGAGIRAPRTPGVAPSALDEQPIPSYAWRRFCLLMGRARDHMGTELFGFNTDNEWTMKMVSI